MRAALRLGRLGGLTVYLNYTWIFAAVLILWWVALLWLPENFPTWGTGLSWLIAVLVLVLYFFSVMAHEWVHSAITRAKGRNANLFPFGAAVPFRLRDLTPGRAIAAALAAPLFNLALGGIFLLLASALPGPEHTLGFLKALLTPLGWLNVWMGTLNLTPGTPFDGGLALAALQYSFTGDSRGGMSIVRSIGWVAALALVLVGAWRGLASDDWLMALALVVAGWSAREAAEVGEQRITLRELLAQLKAADFMDTFRPDDAVQETDTVADMVRAHPRFSPTVPLPVLDASGRLTGLTTLGITETLLQGTWPSTPVRSIATPLAEVKAVSPSTTLVDVLSVTRGGLGEDELSIPVIDNGRLVGSIDPARLQSFELAGRQAGVEEAMEPADETSPGFLHRAGALLPIIILLAAMAILGNIALRTDPVALQDASAGSEQNITFSNFSPADGDIVGYGPLDIKVQVEGTSPVVSATIMVDNQLLDTTLEGLSPLTTTAYATIDGLTLGPHSARINAATEKGHRKSAQWQFRVSSSVAQPTTEPEPTPTVAAASPITMTVLRQIPALGGRVLAGEGEVTLGADVRAAAAPSGAEFSLDGKPLSTKLEPVSGAQNVFRVSASSPAVGVGLHVVRLQVTSSGGSHTDSWTFSALKPDASNAYFKETGYFVGQPFLKYWQERGGLGLFGFPISDVIQERDDATGEVYTAQYFERARFEQHPSLGDQVVLGRLGALLKQPEPAEQPKPGAQFFPETGHNVSPVFLKYWNDNGGLAVFGYPITEERTEKNPADGKEYAVQYFERNRFELHPEAAGTPGEVQLGLLGRELYRQKYGR